MKFIIFNLLVMMLFFGCTKKQEVIVDKLPHTKLTPTTFDKLPNFYEDNFDEVVKLFRQDCKTKQANYIYEDLCQEAKNTADAKSFITKNFSPYIINNEKEDNVGLLTGYYEAQINASYRQSQKYKYPIYTTPKDLVTVDLSSVYPALKQYNLRGMIKGNKLVPYYTRAESKLCDMNASVLCYCDSQIDKFFLEIQGSGVAHLDDGSSINLRYSNRNGHKYRSIGKYLVAHGEMQMGEVSLQSIRKWLLEHPSRVDEVLNYNESLIFFSKTKRGITGALGLELTQKRSIAVDKRYILLGSMLYLHANLNKSKISKIVFAQDTGSAIKGKVRADLFVGSGNEALKLAGHLKAPLKLWIILPKNIKKSR